MRSMRCVGGMLGDDGAVGLLRHDEPKKIFAYLIVGVGLQFGGRVLSRRRACVVDDYFLSLSTLNRQPGKRRERSAERKHNF